MTFRQARCKSKKCSTKELIKVATRRPAEVDRDLTVDRGFIKDKFNCKSQPNSLVSTLFND